MIMGKVVGNIWATRKDESLNGLKFLVIKPVEYEKEGKSKTFIAADAIGAGVGETVLVTKGSSARWVFGNNSIPVDATIIGIIDIVEVEKGKLE